MVFAFAEAFYNTRFGYGKTIAELTQRLHQRVNIEIFCSAEDRSYLEFEMRGRGLSDDAYSVLEPVPDHCTLNSFMPNFGVNNDGDLCALTFPFLTDHPDYDPIFKHCEWIAENYLNKRNIPFLRMPFPFGTARLAANDRLVLVSSKHHQHEQWFNENIDQCCCVVPHLETENTGDLDVFLVPVLPDTWLLTRFPSRRSENATVDSVKKLLEHHGQTVIPIPGLDPIRYDDVDCLPGYANMLLVNGLAIVPLYGCSEDRTMMKIMQVLGYTVCGVDGRKVAESNAVFHCMSKCIPRTPVDFSEPLPLVAG